jgi:hypothetical protein
MFRHDFRVKIEYRARTLALCGDHSNYTFEQQVVVKSGCIHWSSCSRRYYFNNKKL